MSNAMSVSKSRWKGALLTGAALAALTPLAAKAQSFSVGIYANPLGTGVTSPNVYNGYSNVYIDPYDTDTLYVYGTVAGTAAPSASYVDGLAYTYFNVNAIANGGTVTGSITGASPVGQFNAGNYVNDNPPVTSQTGNGAQNGSIAAITTTGGVAVGSTSALTSIAKARSSSAFYCSSTTSSSSNVVVSGNNVSFLLETLTYTPNGAAVGASSPGSPVSVSFNVSIPSVSTTYGSQYAPANYFVGLPSVPALGSTPGAANTNTGTLITAPTSNITLTNALPGDINLDGTVNVGDFNILAGNYLSSTTGGWSAGDLNDDGVVNVGDFNLLAGNYLASIGGAPSGLGQPTALIAPAGAGSSVPEPTAGLLLAAGAGLSMLRRRKAK